MGDTHGQLADVLHILYHLGPPSGKNRYLFNGDMVDRGSQARFMNVKIHEDLLEDDVEMI